jgi:hypothetical protein
MCAANVWCRVLPLAGSEAEADGAGGVVLWCRREKANIRTATFSAHHFAVRVLRATRRRRPSCRDRDGAGGCGPSRLIRRHGVSGALPRPGPAGVARRRLDVNRPPDQFSERWSRSAGRNVNVCGRHARLVQRRARRTRLGGVSDAECARRSDGRPARH